MKLRALRIANVRRFASEGVAIERIEDGLNVFAAPNEAGKSTLFDSLHALLFTKLSSRASTVRSLKPYAGGSPHISADVERDGGLYRIEKQFLGQAFARVTDLGTARVIALADEAQEWIEEFVGAGEGSQGPTGLLWVRQGESSNLERGSEARTDALANIIEDEVTALTGGERARRVLERCVVALNEMVTETGKPKANGGYTLALGRVEQLSRQCTELKDKLDKVHEALDERQGTRRKLAELNDPQREREEEQRLSAARIAKDEADKHHARVETARTKLDLAILAEKNAQRERDTFADNCDAARDRADELKEQEELVPDQRGATTAAIAARDQLQAASERADESLRAAKRLLADARRAEEVRQAKEKHDESSQNLAQVEAADSDARKKRAAANALRIRQDDLDELSTLSIDVTKAEHALDSVSTRLRVSYEPGRSAGIRIGSTTLEDGVDVRIDQASALTIDDVGSLSITPGSADGGDTARHRLRTARQALADTLEQLGCKNPAHARKLFNQREELLREAAQAEAIVEVRAPRGIEALRIEVAQLHEKLDASFKEEIPDVGTAEEAVEDAEKKERKARIKWETARERAESATSKLQRLEGNLVAAKQAHGRELERVDLSLEKWPERKKQLEKDVRKATREATKCRKTHRELMDKQINLEFATAELKRFTKARENQRQEARELQTHLAVLRERIENAAEEGVEEAFSDISGQLQAALAHKTSYESEIAALRRLRAAVEQETAHLKERYLEPVNKEIGPLLGLLYDDAHLDFDGETLTPQQLTRGGVPEDIEALSGGTREQVAILTRLAFARLLAKSGRTPPIILDDALIFSDDDRIQKMFTALNAQARDLQIIVLSCRQRAFQDLGGNVLRLQPWMPNQDPP